MQKNEIYVEMLKEALPYIRNVQTNGFLRKATDWSCYYEAELIHNLPRKILIQDFTESDIHFLNYQAKYYFENCNSKISINYDQQIKNIKELFKLVPNNLKDKLNWQGPN